MGAHRDGEPELTQQPPDAHSGHRDHSDRFIVIIRIGHRDRSEATLGGSGSLSDLPPGLKLATSYQVIALRSEATLALDPGLRYLTFPHSGVTSDSTDFSINDPRRSHDGFTSDLTDSS
jgi:hypothetical protein